MKLRAAGCGLVGRSFVASMLALMVSMSGACVARTKSADTTHASTTTSSSKEWKVLFDGSSMNAWRGYKMDTMPSGWHIVDGTLTKGAPTEDIVTREQFGDFELELEWTISKGGNSGIFYRGNENYERIYYTAPEYQLLDDDNHPDGRSRMTSAGADVALYPSPPGYLKAVGEWNRTRIVARGPHVEHWLNGTKLLEYEQWSPDWEAKYRVSKFAEWAPDYGRLESGYIGIQGDHPGVLAVRNIRVRTLH